MPADDSLNAIAIARRIGECLDEDGIPYGIGGALALGVWGAPRATKDVDLSAFVPRSELPRVLDSLERAGVMLDRAAATSAVNRIGLCRGQLGGLWIDVFISDHPQYEEMRRRSRRIADDAGSLCFISAEDVVLHKLIYGRPKDVIDLENLIPARPGIDLAYVRSWLAKMVPPGDRRFALLDDLERRFVE
jgi:hypothetical protein